MDPSEIENELSYHRLGALDQSRHGAFQVSIFSWSIRKNKDLRGGRSCCQSQLSVPDVTRKEKNKPIIRILSTLQMSVLIKNKIQRFLFSGDDTE